MNTLITGGAGFIGSHLAEKLLKLGHKVFVIDDLSTGSIENIIGFKNHENFHYKIDSIFNKYLLAELVDRCDQIYHLAAAVGVKLIIESPVRTIETNIKGTEILFELAAKKKKKVLTTSTSEVYGKNSNESFSENDDLVLGPSINSRWCYACSKAIDEFLALAYFKEKKLPVIIVRLFNTVGPRQTGQYGMVIPTFVKQALKGEPVTVYGDGSQTRCFSYIDDVTWALVKLMNKDDAVGEVFNIGSQEEISIHDLAEKVIKLTGSKSQIQYIPYDEAYETGFEDMKRRFPNIDKVKKTIGFNPHTSINEIILKIADSMNQKL